MITARWYCRVSEKEATKILNHLQEVQFWSYDKIREYQFHKLRKLLEHAYAHVPYYKKVLKKNGVNPSDIRNFDDFKAYPILTKEIIRENFDELIAENVPRNSLIANSTGGSTGEPLHFYQDQQFENWANAGIMRGWYNLAGCEIGDLSGVLWGAMNEIKTDFSTFERLRALFKVGEIQLNAFNLSEERKRGFIRWCRVLRPKLLRGYVTAVKDLAHFIDENGISFPELKGVILCAETVDEHTQAYIEKVFKAHSYNTYGGRELSLIGMECEYKNGLHEVSENNYVEYENIDLAGYTNAGNLIITNLNNYAMPFIRYRVGDIGVPGSLRSCGCGRGLPLIRKVIGRTTEVFIFGDGTKIAGEMFIHLMKDFPISEYQFIQVSDSKITLRLKKSDCVSEDLKRSMRETYRKYLPDNAKLEFEEVEGFEKTPTGKFRFVRRELSS